MACATALIGESARARQQLRTALSYVGHSQRQTSLYYEYEGWIALLAEDYPTAEQALTEGLHIALKIAPESDLVSQIKRLFGDLYIATGKFSRARKFAREALKVAEKLNERAEIAACYRVFAQVDQNSGKNKSALEWYGKAIDLFNLIGSRYELAVTRYLAGVSDIYTTSERTALLFLAREYFASEEIAHYIEKVDRALKDTAPAVVKRCRQSRDRETDVIVASEVMQKILERIDHLAGSEMAILLTGATGTGKDVFARYIHRLSGRSGEFVPVNMGALSTGIAEAELFGHRKGAFTGAHDNHTGLVERADKGTLFLNEIGEISPALQVTLLDVLENREVRRVGGSKHRPVAFRPIAATNQDMKKLLEDGRFRPDLYHRLSEIEIHLPPLSDRRDDIPPLVTYFLGLLGSTVKTNGTQGDFRRLCGLLSAVDWPGNIRELKSRIGELHNAHKDDYAAMADEVLRWPDESDVDILDRVLTFTDGNRRRAAVLLGVSEGTVRYRKSRGNSRTGDL
ncbi:MAG: sigma 54-interacting transcriptional regulator [candidate division Zixibacteria bacterium]|nr:sigma 54-interacting transcriptional regulator [candidate division Zixibacteria bacterium]